VQGIPLFSDATNGQPYNSILGEFFRCTWDVNKVPEQPICSNAVTTTISESYGSTASAYSLSSHALSRETSKSTQSSLRFESSPTISPSSSHQVLFLTEQVLHHPPVSAFHAECKSAGLTLTGYDHICARFTGTCTSQRNVTNMQRSRYLQENIITEYSLR
jgi:oxysterol-binding protein-related protein 9/10/11